MFRGFGSRMFVLCECLWATSTFFLGHTARRWWSCWGFLLLNKTIVSIITLPLVAEIYDSMDEQWWTTSKNIRKKKGTSENIVNIYVGLMHVFIMLYLKNVFSWPRLLGSSAAISSQVEQKATMATVTLQVIKRAGKTWENPSNWGFSMNFPWFFDWFKGFSIFSMRISMVWGRILRVFHWYL